MKTPKRIKKIREDFFELHDKVSAAYKSGDLEMFRKYQQEYIEYIGKFQKELKLADEVIEDLRKDFDEAEVLNAEIDYLEARIERLKKESKEEKEKYYENVLKREKRGEIKWN